MACRGGAGEAGCWPRGVPALRSMFEDKVALRSACGALGGQRFALGPGALPQAGIGEARERLGEPQLALPAATR